MIVIMILIISINQLVYAYNKSRFLTESDIDWTDTKTLLNKGFLKRCNVSYKLRNILSSIFDPTMFSGIRL